MSTIVVESDNPNDSVTDIEEKLEKAVSAVIEQREGKQFTDLFLKKHKEKADKIVQKVFVNMISEIDKVLKGD